MEDSRIPDVSRRTLVKANTSGQSDVYRAGDQEEDLKQRGARNLLRTRTTSYAVARRRGQESWGHRDTKGKP